MGPTPPPKIYKKKKKLGADLHTHTINYFLGEKKKIKLGKKRVLFFFFFWGDKKKKKT
jgi:hypothetical protein